MRSQHARLLSAFLLVAGVMAARPLHAQIVEQKLNWTPLTLPAPTASMTAPAVTSASTKTATATSTTTAKTPAVKAVKKAKAVKKTPTYPLKTKLALQKKNEMEKKWNDCVRLAPGNFQADASLRGWILESWLHCAVEKSDDGSSYAGLTAAINTLSAHPELLTAGPWRKILFSDSVKARLALIDGVQKSKPQEAWKQVNALIALKDQLSKNQRAKVYQEAAELSKNKAQLKAAKSFYEYSLAEAETSDVRNDYNALLFALNENKTETAPTPTPVQPLTDAEQKFEDRLQSSVKNNDLITQVEDCVSYLKQFPNGLRAKWAQDRILEIYSSFLNQTGNEKMDALRERTLSIMLKVDAVRALDWAKALFRRADYRGSLKLAARALDVLDGTSAAAQVLFIAGRSAELTGDYTKAQKYFQKYIDAQSGGGDLNEVLFRMALSQIRLEQYSSAIANLEKLLVQKNVDRYEVAAHYWLTRALQWTKNTRAQTEADLVIAQYPMTYYGLRLSLEKQKGAMEWPTALTQDKPLQGSYVITEEQKKIWDRIEQLGKNGWTSEMLMEISALPDPTDAAVKVLLAQEYQRIGAFPPVIKLVNEAGNKDSSLRSYDIINLGLPQVYQDLIDDQAQTQKLNPVLVRSLIRQESAFGPRALSSANAQGLMQIIPPTADQIVGEMGLSNVEVPNDLAIPEVNITMGTYYIAKMIRQFGGCVPLGLAAYNAGPMRMQAFVSSRPEVSLMTKKQSADPWDELWIDELPWSETSFYVKAILRNTILYRLADKAQATTPDERRVQFPPVLWSDLVVQ
jgi:soluble lytic murein transglycosylase